MIKLVLSPEQAQAVSNSTETIELFDQNGKFLGVFSQALTADEIAAAKKRLSSNKPRYTTDEVLQHIQALDK